MIALWLSLAGGAGAITRYVLDTVIRARWPLEFPVGTLLINVSGSLILGVLTGLVIAHGASSDLKAIAGTGFCGGYTTFSAASVETVRLAEQRRWLACLSYAAGSLVLALLAAGAGLAVTGA
ncbi:MAG TPA: fluoride efflux transporter CrcB [Mycobacteriales bacterium]|jgi:CrcB protein|nr:fluoride efflux transporter CrcB [Mycobacteriales bacterium]